MRYELTDRAWSAIRPMLPNKPRGVPRVDDRRVLNGIFWVLRSGAPWRDLPKSYGPHTTCYNRFVRWRRAGVWDQIMDALAVAHNAAVQMIDTSVVRVHQHGACFASNREQQMGRSRGGLTSKIHAVVDADGLPVRLGLTAGEAHDNQLCSVLLGRLHPHTMLLADRGYDADSGSVIPAPQKIGAQIMRYELSTYEWSVIRPMLPNKHAAFPASTTAVSSTASSGSCDQVRRAAICRKATVPTQLATIASSAGGRQVSGTGSWRRWPPLMTRRCR